MFGTIKTMAYYIGQSILPILLAVPLIDIWSLVVLAFLLNVVLRVQYWKFISAFVIAVVAIGLFLATFVPSLFH